MKIVFAGTPDFAAEPLKGIINAGYDVVGIITQPDKPQGRKGIITPSPVKKIALDTGIDVYQFDKIRNHVNEVKAIGADLMVTCAYGQILTREMLDLFPLGVWNIHASLLPKYRGASPIQHCVLNGEKYTGITIMKTEEGLDTGDILLVKRTEIGDEETSGELSARLSLIAKEAVLDALPLIERGDCALLLQDALQATTVGKITREEAKVDFSANARTIVNKVRAMNPSPVAYAVLNGAALNIYKASAAECDTEAEVGTVISDSPKKGLIVKCAGGAVNLEEVQLPGGKRMKGSDLLNGRKIAKGQRFDF